MTIEVIHNPWRLSNRKLLKVTNAKAAKLHIDEFIDSRVARGYRLRVVNDDKENTLLLQSRKAINVDMAIRELDRAGFQPKKLCYKDCQLFLQNNS